MAKCEPGIALRGEDKEVRDGLNAALSGLQVFVSREFAEDAPDFSGIFKKQFERIEQAEATSVAKSPKNIVEPELSTALIAMDRDGRVPDPILPKLARLVIDNSRQLARHYLTEDPLDERAYLLNRSAMWGSLAYLPPADVSGKTQINLGIGNDVLRAYRAAVSKKKYDSILPALEISMSNAPFWIEGQYLLSRVLEGLDARPALLCVSNCVQLLASRFPELLSYKFKDGTPFASSETIIWINALHSGYANQSEVPSNGEPESGARKGGTSLLNDALMANVENGFEAGIKILGKISPNKSRESIRHRIQVAQYCLGTGKRGAGILLLQSIYEQLEAWQLTEWEPELTAEVLRLLIPAMKTKPKDAMLKHLHWLDLETALSLTTNAVRLSTQS